MTVDITTAAMVLVYACMAGYIVFLQYRLRQVKYHAGMLSMAIKDIMDGTVKLEKKDGKLNITRI